MKMLMLLATEAQWLEFHEHVSSGPVLYVQFSWDINSGGEHSYLPRFIDKGVETQKIQELPQRDTIQKENITLEPEAL